MVSWNEFKVSYWRKKEYMKLFINIAQKCLTDLYVFEFQELSAPNRILLKHILEANEASDIQKYEALIKLT
jgi:hypothetical protein